MLALREKAKRKTRLSAKPYILYLDAVSYCNLRCPFCPTGAKTSDRKAAKLSLENFIDLMSGMGKYLFELRFYNWGESLLNGDLPQMIEYARKYHIAVTVSTNLSVPIGEQKARELVSSGLDFLICSIDGASQESYQKYRVGGNFELVMNNLELLQRLKKEQRSDRPIIVWQFLVFRHNEHEIEEARQRAKDLGVDIYFETPFLHEWEGKTLRPEDWVSTIPRFAADIKIRTRYGSRLIDNGRASMASNEPCSWLWSATAVTPDGSVSPCCGIIDERDDFGQIDGKWSIDEVWNNDNYRDARRFFAHGKVSRSVICRKCPVPDIQQYSRNHDQQILVDLLAKSPRLINLILKSYLKNTDEALHNMMPQS